MTHIEQLNKRLGEALGYAGAEPRFKWMRSHEAAYFFRPQTALSFQKFTWADSIGKCWVLCQWRAPRWFDASGQAHEITREGWFQSFRGEFPYPDKGMYYAHPEMALPPGVEPNAEVTQRCIHAIRTQMDKTYKQHLDESNEWQQKARDENEREFFDMVDDWFPAFWKNGVAHEPGTRGCHVSFGGI